MNKKIPVFTMFHAYLCLQNFVSKWKTLKGNKSKLSFNKTNSQTMFFCRFIDRILITYSPGSGMESTFCQ